MYGVITGYFPSYSPNKMYYHIDLKDSISSLPHSGLSAFSISVKNYDQRFVYTNRSQDINMVFTFENSEGDEFSVSGGYGSWQDVWPDRYEDLIVYQVTGLDYTDAVSSYKLSSLKVNGKSQELDSGSYNQEAVIRYNGNGSLSGGTNTLDDDTPYYGSAGLASDLDVTDPFFNADVSWIGDYDGLGKFSYEWFIDGVLTETAKDFAPLLEHQGSAIYARVSWTDTDGNTNESITPTRIIGEFNDLPKGEITITGIRVQYETLTADVSSVVDEDGIDSSSWTYQWMRDGVVLEEERNGTYTLTQDDVGKQITVSGTYIDLFNRQEIANSSESGSIANVNDSPSGNVGLNSSSGLFSQGSMLSIVDGIEDIDSGVDRDTYTYQWYRDGVIRENVTGPKYYLRQDDVGTKISVQVTYQDLLGGTNVITSSPIAPVINTDDPINGSAVITGIYLENEILSADISGISDLDGINITNFTYEWFRHTSGSWEGDPWTTLWLADEVQIDGAHESTYQLTQEDVASQISLRVSYVDEFGGTGSSEIDITTPDNIVENINDAPEGGVWITIDDVVVGDSQLEQGQTLKAHHNITDNDGISNSYNYAWHRNDVLISGASQQTYVTTQEDVGSTITGSFNYHDGQFNREKVNSPQTGFVQNVNDAPTGRFYLVGSSEQGGQLKADLSHHYSRSTIEDLDGIDFSTFKYAWYLAEAYSDQEIYSLVPNETSQTIKITNGLFPVGVEYANLKVVISYKDLWGNDETISSLTRIRNTDDKPTGYLKPLGVAKQGETLVADWSELNDPDGIDFESVQYFWTTGGSSRSETSTPEYVLNQAEVGGQVYVQVSFDDLLGNNYFISPYLQEDFWTAEVANVDDTFNGFVEIIGTLMHGESLRASVNGNDPDGHVRDAITMEFFNYQWMRNGKDISNATDSSYVLTKEDFDMLITVKVTYTDGYGETGEVLGAVTQNVPRDQDLQVYGDYSSDYLEGLTGHDRLYGYDSDDQLFGGYGDDSLFGGSDDDLLEGEEGDDELYGEAGADRLFGGSGDDLLDGGVGADYLSGGQGNDKYVLDNEGDVIEDLGLQNDIDHVVIQYATTFTLLDILEAAELDNLAGESSIVGNNLNNFLKGNASANHLYGNGGDDIIEGGADNDILSGGVGNDLINGGTGKDFITADDGADLIEAGSGEDTIYLFSSEVWTFPYFAQNIESGERLSLTGKTKFSSVIDGQEDEDTLNLTDSITGDAFFLHDSYSDLHDSLTAVDDGMGRTTVARVISLETINAGDGDDVIDLTSPTFDMGGIGMTINGEAGNDTIWAAEGDDELYGGDDDDILFGGEGDDILTGGSGADIFEFKSSNTAQTDRITDYTKKTR